MEENGTLDLLTRRADFSAPAGGTPAGQPPATLLVDTSTPGGGTSGPPPKAPPAKSPPPSKAAPSTPPPATLGGTRAPAEPPAEPPAQDEQVDDTSLPRSPQEFGPPQFAWTSHGGKGLPAGGRAALPLHHAPGTEPRPVQQHATDWSSWTGPRHGHAVGGTSRGTSRPAHPGARRPSSSTGSDVPPPEASGWAPEPAPHHGHVGGTSGHRGQGKGEGLTRDFGPIFFDEGTYSGYRFVMGDLGPEIQPFQATLSAATRTRVSCLT